MSITAGLMNVFWSHCSSSAKTPSRATTEPATALCEVSSRILLGLNGSGWSAGKGSSPAGLLPEADFETVEIASQRLRSIDYDLKEFTGGLTQADLDGSRDYKTMEGKAYSNVLSDMLVHVANHSSYHRGQVATLLRQSGAVPQSTDLILFIRSKELNLGSH